MINGSENDSPDMKKKKNGSSLQARRRSVMSSCKFSS